jgi:cyclase
MATRWSAYHAGSSCFAGNFANMKPKLHACIAAIGGAVLFASIADAAQPASPATSDGLCTVSVKLPPPSGPMPDIAAIFGKPDPKAEPPRIEKLRDDVYVIRNATEHLSEILQFGGNITVYVTPEGVILFDSKVEPIHDHVVKLVRSVTDKPIRYVVVTHNHGDHAGGVAAFAKDGATIVMSRDDALAVAAQGLPAPQVSFSRFGTVALGGKQARLTEYCGHTRGDTVAWLPAARVVVAGDLVTTPEGTPTIVGYADGGNWTDLVKSLDAVAALDFDFLVGGHGPVLTKVEFLKYRDRVVRIGVRARELVKQGKSPAELVQAMSRELNWGTGPAAMVIPGMMVEFR